MLFISLFVEVSVGRGVASTCGILLSAYLVDYVCVCVCVCVHSGLRGVTSFWKLCVCGFFWGDVFK